MKKVLATAQHIGQDLHMTTDTTITYRKRKVTGLETYEATDGEVTVVAESSSSEA